MKFGTSWPTKKSQPAMPDMSVKDMRRQLFYFEVEHKAQLICKNFHWKDSIFFFVFWAIIQTASDCSLRVVLSLEGHKVKLFKSVPLLSGQSLRPNVWATLN